MNPGFRITALTLLGLFSAVTSVRADVTVGQPFPQLTDRAALVGQMPATAGQVVLVDFWATWCAPCRSSFPAYKALQQEFGARGLVIIGVSVDQDENHYSRFVERFSPGFTTLRDSEQTLVKAVRPPAMPTCYLVDRHGVLRSEHTGFHGESTIRRLRTEILKLLEETP